MAFTWAAEYTDTFGGVPNYSWVRRVEFTPKTDSPRAIVTAAKAALGLTGTRCRTFEDGEGYELRPLNSCTVVFIYPVH